MKMKSVFMSFTMLMIVICAYAQQYDSFKDPRDGKIYKTVKIGTQTWMANNLSYKASSGCYAYDNNKSNVAIYGYLYILETAKKVCPTGWHLPSMAEWNTLITNTGGIETASNKLKEAGIKHWAEPNTGATNQSGFTALPGGERQENGQFLDLNVLGTWWTTDVNTEFSKPFYLSITIKVDPDLQEFDSYVWTSSYSKEVSCSVRCVKNN